MFKASDVQMQADQLLFVVKEKAQMILLNKVSRTKKWERVEKEGN
jgi:hypothetical protein